MGPGGGVLLKLADKLRLLDYQVLSIELHLFATRTDLLIHVYTSNKHLPTVYVSRTIYKLYLMPQLSRPVVTVSVPAYMA